MGYINYKDMSEQEFDDMKSRLNSVERISSPIMQMRSFYLNRRDYDDYLILDYLHDGELMGNIGVRYDEEESSIDKRVFDFYITKSYDLNSRRFFVRKGLGRKFTLIEIDEEFVSLFEECLFLYDQIKKEDITESFELPKLKR
jgi:hypothetical protein